MHQKGNDTESCSRRGSTDGSGEHLRALSRSTVPWKRSRNNALQLPIPTRPAWFCPDHLPIFQFPDSFQRPFLKGYLYVPTLFWGIKICQPGSINFNIKELSQEYFTTSKMTAIGLLDNWLKDLSSAPSFCRSILTGWKLFMKNMQKAEGTVQLSLQKITKGPLRFYPRFTTVCSIPKETQYKTNHQVRLERWVTC